MSIFKAVSTAKSFIQAAIEDQLHIGNGHGQQITGHIKADENLTRMKWVMENR